MTYPSTSYFNQTKHRQIQTFHFTNLIGAFNFGGLTNFSNTSTFAFDKGPIINSASWLVALRMQTQFSCLNGESVALAVALSGADLILTAQGPWLLLRTVSADATNTPFQRSYLDQRFDLAVNPIFMPAGTIISGYASTQNNGSIGRGYATVEWIIE